MSFKEKVFDLLTLVEQSVKHHLDVELMLQRDKAVLSFLKGKLIVHTEVIPEGRMNLESDIMDFARRISKEAYERARDD